MSRKSLFISLAIGFALITAVAAFCAVKGCPRGSVSSNMQAIEAYLPTLEAAIANDAAFANVKVFPTTAHGGTIEIEGTLSRRDFDRLRAIVDSTSPPRPVKWFVEVKDDTKGQ